MIENPRTGEQIEFNTSDPEVLVMHSRWTRPGHRAAAHVHPKMEERFEVIEGKAAFLVAGRRIDAVAGESVLVPPGVEHLAWNPTDEHVRLRIEMRPPLRWAEFTRRLFAGEPVQSLLNEFSAEIVVSGGRVSVGPRSLHTAPPDRPFRALQDGRPEVKRGASGSKARGCVILLRCALTEDS